MHYTLFILIFLIACLIQLYYAVFFAFAKKDKVGAANDEQIPTSIIICTKNEAENLQQFLPFVLEQDYPKALFEVIVVNDQSTDESAIVLEEFARLYPNLNIVTIDANTVKTLPGKKFALSQGIAAAKFDHLLLTDADCKPASNQWLAEFNSKYNIQNPKLVLGYGAYESDAGILNKFIRWETAHTCMQYSSYALAGLPYMGVGRNLAYSKSLLKDLENDAAFQEIYTSTPSGDDDLLICKIATKDNVAICLNKEAHTISVPQKTWTSWWKQKTRHMSTGKYYPKKVKNLLGLYALSHCLYWFVGLFLVAMAFATGSESPFSIWEIDCVVLMPNYFTRFIILLFFIRLFLYWLNASSWYKTLNEKKLLLFYPLGDLGWAFYNVFLSPYILWKNKQAWK